MPTSQIKALRDEAIQFGDDVMVIICDCALDGDPEAEAECRRVVNYAAALAA